VKKHFAQRGQPDFPIYRIHVTDQNNLDVCYHPPNVTEECQSLERIKGTWRIVGRLITAPNIPTT
jgi:hypothetical protein